MDDASFLNLFWDQGHTEEPVLSLRVTNLFKLKQVSGQFSVDFSVDFSLGPLVHRISAPTTKQTDSFQDFSCKL